jgi:AAA family ATP:ADP antiporter
MRIKKARKKLVKILEMRLDSTLERIFHLLALKYPKEDIYNVYLGLRSEKSDTRVNAVEFLDNLLTVNLKKVIIPIVETTLVDALIEKSLERLGLRISSEFDSLVMLLSEDDNQVNATALVLIAELRDERYVSYVGSLIHSSDPAIKANAELVLRKMGIL